VDREQFLFGFSGKYQPSLDGPFYVSHYFFLLHDAGPAIAIPDDHIRDNGAAQIRLGANLSHKTFLDSLSFEAGGMLSLERSRGIDGWQKPKGFVASAYASYKRFALMTNFTKATATILLLAMPITSIKPITGLILFTPLYCKRLKRAVCIEPA
jgi:hypothetical protein